MVSFREENQRIAAEWRAQVELPGRWTRSSSQAGLLSVDRDGEAGGFFVELDAVGRRRAYLKPLKRHGWKRAAREKIAADLAFELGVRVPPVLLTENGATADAERFACVSLLLYPHQFSWVQLKEFLADGESAIAAEVATLIPQPAARAFAFDTWLDQTDHGDHPSNIVFGYEDRDYQRGQFIFLDFAFSMGVSGSWANGGFVRCVPAPFPPRMRAVLAPAELAAAVTAIEAIPDEVVTHIVSRIPWQWLADAEKHVILAGLLARRRMVRATLAHYMGEQS